MKSPNELAGTTISELEATLIMVKKLLNREIEAGHKGLIIAKGKPNEVKQTYKSLIQPSFRTKNLDTVAQK